MRIIIFSKNRAAQAELLLRSIKEQVVGWEKFLITVLYHFDDENFNKGYLLLKEIHPEFHYCEEENSKPLKEQICNLLSMEKKSFFSFFVDDLVVIRPFGISDSQFETLRKNARGDVTALSLRLNPHVTYCQPLNRQVYPPKIDSRGLFVYKKTIFGHFHERNICSRMIRRLGLKEFLPVEGDWANPMRIDGNVFRFDEFKEYFFALPQEEFKKIPDIESLMMKKPLPGKTMVIYPESRIINIASNRVRAEKKFSCREENAADINKRFLNKGRLAYDHLKNMDNKSCHLEMDLKFR